MSHSPITLPSTPSPEINHGEPEVTNRGAGSPFPRSQVGTQPSPGEVPILTQPPTGSGDLRPPVTPEVTSAANPAADLVNRLHARGVTVAIRGKKVVLSPPTAYKHLSDDERTTLRLHRADIKEFIRAAGPHVQLTTVTTELAPQAATPTKPTRRAEPEPVVYVGRHRIAEHDVRESLRNFGDDTLADYIAGRLSKADAYEMTRCGLREMEQRR